MALEFLGKKVKKFGAIIFGATTHKCVAPYAFT
jgi:hypothetical protein